VSLFGWYCLFGMSKKLPKVGYSMLIQPPNICNAVIVVHDLIETPFVQNIGQFGVDFVFDHMAMRVTVCYQQVMGRDDAVVNCWHHQGGGKATKEVDC